MYITSKECSFSGGSFTTTILLDASWDVFFTLVEDEVEALLFVFLTVPGAILAVSAALYIDDWRTRHSQLV